MRANQLGHQSISRGTLGFVCIVLGILIGVAIGYSQPPPTPQATAPMSQARPTTKADLEAEKLGQEIRKLQIENTKADGHWGRMTSLGPMVTALVAVLGALATFWKLMNERAQDREQRETESLRWQAEQENNRVQREAESKRWVTEQQNVREQHAEESRRWNAERTLERQRRVEENFTAIVRNLGCDKEPDQASAVVSMMTFMKPAYQDFHSQAFMILLANLKIRRRSAGSPVNDLLIRAFEDAIRTQLATKRARDEPCGFNLAHTYLCRVNLSKLNLCQVDLGFAEMEGANLTEANLFRVRGIQVGWERARLSRADLGEARLKGAFCPCAQFHGTNLVAAHLKEADLAQAQFQQARLQSAHFDGAYLQGALFHEADVNDTFFWGAHFDETALISLRKARNWQYAHFDEPVKKWMEGTAVP